MVLQACTTPHAPVAVQPQNVHGIMLKTLRYPGTCYSLDKSDEVIERGQQRHRHGCNHSCNQVRRLNKGDPIIRRMMPTLQGNRMSHSSAAQWSGPPGQGAVWGVSCCAVLQASAAERISGASQSCSRCCRIKSQHPSVVWITGDCNSL